MRIFIVLSAVGALFATGYFLWTDHSRLVKRLDRVERQERESELNAAPAPEAVRTVVAAATTPVPSLFAAPIASEAPSPPAAQAPRAADPGPSKEQFSATLEDFFAKLPSPSASTRTVRTQLVEALGKLQLGDAQLSQVDCRGSLCRAEFTKLNENQGRDLAQQIPNMGWTGPLTAMVLDDERGGKVLRVYAAQQGAELPMPL